MHDTLKELSDHFGVSPSTISRALSGRELKYAGARERAEEIRRLAEQLGYEPNSVARSLKTNRSLTIGLLVPSIMNDYYATAATLVQETLMAEGYRVIFCVTHDDPESEANYLRILREERVAGIITVPSPQTNKSQHVVPFTGPAVDLVRQSAEQTHDAVLIDDVDAGIQGTQHLIDLGHRRIAIMIGPSGLSTAHRRLEGYRQAFQRAAIPFDEALVLRGPYRREFAYTATVELMKRAIRPTALIATSNEFVVGTLQALHQENVRIPEELSVVGFDNPDWYALLRPALTTVALPIREMSMVAAQTLLFRIREQLAGTEGPPAQERRPLISRYQAHLVVRTSTRAVEQG